MTRDHFVPQFYLRLWADDQDRVRAFDKIDRRDAGLIGTHNLALENDFHATKDRSGAKTRELEPEIAKLESDWAKSLTALKQGDLGSKSLRWSVSQFVAFQYVRTQHWRSVSMTATGQAIKSMFQSMAAAGLADPGLGEQMIVSTLGSDVTWSQGSGILKTIKEGHYDVEPPAAYHLSAMVDALDDDVVEVLADREWVLATPLNGSRFVSSDHPVTLGSPRQYYGLSNAHEVALPLTPHLALLMGARGRWRESSPGVASLRSVAIVNARTAAAASRFVITSPSAPLADIEQSLAGG